MRRAVGFGVLWALMALLASVPLWGSLPEPASGRIDTAERYQDGAWTRVSLPQAGRPAGGWEHYRIRFDWDGRDPVTLYLPTISQRAVVEVAGERIADTENRTTLVSLASGVPALVALPGKLLERGGNQVDIRVQTLGLVPGYLSTLYVDKAERLAPYYRTRVFVLEYLRLMVPAGQLLIALVVLVVWLYRPQESLFGWLFLLLTTSMFVYLGMMRELLPAPVEAMYYAIMAGSAACEILVITALLIAGVAPPRWLKVTVPGVPAACILVSALGLVPAAQVVLFVNAPLNMVGQLAALAIMVWAALARRVEEAWLLVLPLLLSTVAALHDFAIIMTWLDGPIFLSVYYRPAMMIGIAMILMRRLGLSLGRLDNVNGYLTQRLREQERELERLHQDERRETAARALSEERRRLTADLHDGLSGHLASIIALSEREKSERVEGAAREALDDLRLVIHSLDIDDHELPVALAGLRERLERQLKRLGVAMDWSLAPLPEIAGVTPSHALNVLRILQEAITNALRHGGATRITVRGARSECGQACITVENDGRPFPRRPERGGEGLINMRRRVRQLNGVIDIESLAGGTRLTLLLPLRLPGAEPDRGLPDTVA